MNKNIELIKQKFNNFKEENKNINFEEGDHEFFRTFVTKGERIISHIINIEFNGIDTINSTSITKKIKEHINIKNKIINEILYIEEFFKAYFEFILDDKLEYHSYKNNSHNMMWKDIIDLCSENSEKLELSEWQINNLKRIKEIRNQFSHNQMYDKSLYEFNKDYDNYIKPIKIFILDFYKNN